MNNFKKFTKFEKFNTLKTKNYLLTNFLVVSVLWIFILSVSIFYLSSTHNKQQKKICHLRQQNKTLIDSVGYYKKKLTECENWLENIENTYIVTATVYNADPRQCNKNCFVTASGFKLDKKDQYRHKIIAVSRDLLTVMPFGTKILIEGTAYDGIYTVQDVMNKRYKKRIDILINKNQKIGKWTGVRARIL